MISWRKAFPHPTPFFGFNTSCFWRWNVLYLYRDMGGAEVPPFFRHFPFKIGDFGAHLGKICLPLILICLPQIFLSLPLSKTKHRVGKIWRRKVFPKVKNVNVESPKKRSKLLVFSAHFFLFPLQVCSWMGSSKRLLFFGGTNCFCWGDTNWFLEHELNTNCSWIVHDLFRINETMNGH